MDLFIFLYGFNGFLAVIGILHILRKIGPNPFVGIRIGKTLGNERLWYEAHVFTGWSMLVSSVVSVVVLASLQTMQRYWFPGLSVELPGALVFAVLLFAGDGIIPLLYILRMPDGHDPSSGTTISETLGSDYAIAVYVLLTFIMMVSSLPGATGRITPNGTYGFRTAKTLSSETLWYASNTFAGWTAIIAGLVTIGGLFALRFGPMGRFSESGYAYLLVYLVPTIASIAITMWYVYWYL